MKTKVVHHVESEWMRDWNSVRVRECENNIKTFRHSWFPAFVWHSDIFSLQAFFLKIKMNTKNLVSDNVLIKIWVCKVRRNSPGRNIGSHNIIVPTTPQSLVPCSFVHNKSPHTFVGSSLVWEKVWKTIQIFFKILVCTATSLVAGGRCCLDVILVHPWHRKS